MQKLISAIQGKLPKPKEIDKWGLPQENADYNLAIADCHLDIANGIQADVEERILQVIEKAVLDLIKREKKGLMDIHTLTTFTTISHAICEALPSIIIKESKECI